MGGVQQHRAVRSEPHRPLLLSFCPTASAGCILLRDRPVTPSALPDDRVSLPVTNPLLPFHHNRALRDVNTTRNVVSASMSFILPDRLFAATTLNHGKAGALNQGSALVQRRSLRRVRRYCYGLLPASDQHGRDCRSTADPLDDSPIACACLQPNTGKPSLLKTPRRICIHRHNRKWDIFRLFCQCWCSDYSPRPKTTMCSTLFVARCSWKYFPHRMFSLVSSKARLARNRADERCVLKVVWLCKIKSYIGINDRRVKGKQDDR